jgi:hypothetical protein
LSAQGKKVKIVKPKQKEKTPKMPQVGIVFLFENTLWIEGTPLEKAGTYGEFKIHEGDHVVYWDRLIAEQKVPPYTQYENVPRGRVAFNTLTRRYRLMLDRCILRDKNAVSNIQDRLNLPLKETDTFADPHYLCARCLASFDPY